MGCLASRSCMEQTQSEVEHENCMWACPVWRWHCEEVAPTPRGFGDCVLGSKSTADQVRKDDRRNSGGTLWQKLNLFDIWHWIFDIWHLTFDVWLALMLLILAQSYHIFIDGFWGYLQSKKIITHSLTHWLTDWTIIGLRDASASKNHSLKKNKKRMDFFFYKYMFAPLILRWVVKLENMIFGPGHQIT